MVTFLEVLISVLKQSEQIHFLQLDESTDIIADITNRQRDRNGSRPSFLTIGNVTSCVGWKGFQNL